MSAARGTCENCGRSGQLLEPCCRHHPDIMVCAGRVGCREYMLATCRGEPPAEPAGIEDVTAAFAGWEIVLTTEGRWQATLTTGPRLAQPRVTGATIAELAAALNDYIAGTGETP
jgi:hypothetical protein